MTTETPIPDNMSLDQAAPKQSHYLTKDDCGTGGILVTIAGMANAELENDGKTETRPILKFVEDVKPMVLNITNRELLKVATGETTVGGIKGKQIVVYNDPTVMFGGEMKGGIRIKAAQRAPAPAQPGDGFEDQEVPF